ncbi:MAG: homoserine dehydrogenase [Chloroflexota bacterium]
MKSDKAVKRDSIGIGLMGLGVIGGQVASVLRDRAKVLSEQAGVPIELRRIKVLPADLERPVAQKLPRALFTTDDGEFFGDAGIDIIIELIGGEEPALSYIKKALSGGKHVVTANKEVIAKHGPELLALARQHGVGIQYEASVGGGIPLIAPFKHDLVANEIKGIYAIINGTTNYILTRMARDGMDFAEALKLAQQMGYAEADPVNDIEGYDARYKLAILASLAFQVPVPPEAIYCEGISRMGSQDFRYARELGLAIKLLAIAKQSDGAIEVRVHPVLISEDSFMAKVDGVYNAVEVEGDLIGKVIFFGEGAGARPTSSAVVSDVVSTARKISFGSGSHPPAVPASGKKLKPMSEIRTRYYLRIRAADHPGVLAKISRVFGDLDISISAAIQQEPEAQTAEVVLTTHEASEKAMQAALQKLSRLDVVAEISNFLRMENI